MNIDLHYYLAVLLRRLHYVILIFAAVSAAALTLALKLPPVYEASATLLLEAPQIPDALAAPTVGTASLEQLQILEQRLLTRPNMLDIARKLRVFPNMRNMTPDDIVSAMQSATDINIHTGRDQAALMTITFDAGQARTAADVVNEYVTRILADNLAMRTSQAQDTLQFFKQEVDRLQGDLNAQSAKIVAFQNANADALPSTLDMRLQQQAALQERLASTERDAASLQDQKQRLIDIFRATGQVAGAGSAAAETPEAKLLTQAKSDLAQALAIYAPDNPKVKMLQARVDQLQSTVDKQANASGATQTAPQPMSMLDIQTADIDSRIKQLNQQHADVEKALVKLKESIDRTPDVAVQLDTLNRDYANIQTHYNAASDRLNKASTGERIEALSKGQRIAVLDAASAPDSPTRPNRPKIAAMGAAAGLVLGFGLVVLLEILNTSIRRPIDLVRGLNITPIGTIPYIRTPGERRWRRFAVGGLFLAVVLGLPAVLYAIDTYYQPLDILLAKVNAKLGL